MLDGVVVSEHMLREMAVAATHGCVGVGGGGTRGEKCSIASSFKQLCLRPVTHDGAEGNQVKRRGVVLQLLLIVDSCGLVTGLTVAGICLCASVV